MTEARYTAKTPTGETLTGTAAAIVRWLQAQDMQPGDGGAEGERQWRRKVAGRVQVQTGRTIPTEEVSAFLLGLAAAGLLRLEQEGDNARNADDNARNADDNARNADDNARNADDKAKNEGA